METKTLDWTTEFSYTDSKQKGIMKHVFAGGRVVVVVSMEDMRVRLIHDGLVANHFEIAQWKPADLLDYLVRIAESAAELESE